MELRLYGKILWRRIWIPLLLLVVVALYAGYQYISILSTPGSLKMYQTNTLLRIGIQANQQNNQLLSDYTSTAEMLADELVSGPILVSPEFTAQVVQQLRADASSDEETAKWGNWDNASKIGSAITSARIRTLVTVNIQWNTAEGAIAIAKAVGEVGEQHISSYLDYIIRKQPTFSQDTHPQASAQVVSTSKTAATIAGTAANKPTMLLALLGVALVLGIGLVFFVEYLDDRLRTRDQVEQCLHLPIYGSIPRAP